MGETTRTRREAIQRQLASNRETLSRTQGQAQTLRAAARRSEVVVDRALKRLGHDK